MRKLTVFMLLILCGWNLSAQKVLFEVNKQEITMDEQLQLMVNVQDRSFAPTPRFPDIRGFVAVGSSQNSVHANGQVKTVFARIYEPQDTGVFRIPKFDYAFRGQTYTSPAFRIHVKEGTGRRQSSSNSQQGNTVFDEFDRMLDELLQGRDNWDSRYSQRRGFMEVVLSDDDIWEGEQISAEIMVFLPAATTQDIQVDPAEFDAVAQKFRDGGYWVEEARQQVKKTGPRTVAGVEYVGYSVGQIYMYPIKTGTLYFPDLRMGVKVEGGGGGTFGNFDHAFTRRLTASSQKVKVRPLPTAPTQDRYLTGQFGIELKPVRNEGLTGEVIDVEVTLRGTGNLNMQDEAPFSFPNVYKVDPPADAYETEIDGGKLVGKKTWYYQLTPVRPGAHSLGTFVYRYFDPVEGKYDSVVVEGPKMRIQGDSLGHNFAGNPAIREFYEDALAEANKDLRGESKGNVWLFFGMILIVGGTGVYIRRRKTAAVAEKPVAKDPEDPFAT